MCLTLRHLSGLDRNNPRPNSRGCNLEICARTETESAYSYERRLSPRLNHLAVALDQSHASQCKMETGDTSQGFEGALCSTPLPSINPHPSGAVAHGAPSLISDPISLNIWLFHQRPSIKPLPVRHAGVDLCAPAFITPQPLCDRQD